MKVVYLTWGETPRSYGVFGSQVLGQFSNTKKYAKEEDEFYFISGLPLVHSGLVRERLAYKEEIQKVKKRLGDISFSIIPIFAPQNFVNSSKATFPFMHYFSNGLLAKKLKEINPDVVHCRSYHAAYAAIKAKQKQNFSYKIIFDARGMWPEEVAIRKNDLNSLDYLYRKSIETFILQHVDITIAVSDTMKTGLEKAGASKVETIYLSADTELLNPNSININTMIDNTAVVFTYVGALSESTWHSPKELHRLYSQLRKKVTNPKLIIATTSDHNEIKKIFSDIPSSEIEYTSFKGIEELKKIFEKTTFGVMSYFNPVSEIDKELSNMVLAVKIAEYISGGLPVIVNKTCGGAATLIEKFGAGITYNPNTFEEITEENLQKYINDGRGAERSLLAKELFDYQTNAAKYYEIYTLLT